MKTGRRRGRLLRNTRKERHCTVQLLFPRPASLANLLVSGLFTQNDETNQPSGAAMITCRKHVKVTITKERLQLPDEACILVLPVL